MLFDRAMELCIDRLHVTRAATRKFACHAGAFIVQDAYLIGYLVNPSTPQIFYGYVFFSNVADSAFIVRPVKS